jgi:hypothetical protein
MTDATGGTTRHADGIQNEPEGSDTNGGRMSFNQNHLTDPPAFSVYIGFVVYFYGK